MKSLGQLESQLAFVISSFPEHHIVGNHGYLGKVITTLLKTALCFFFQQVWELGSVYPDSCLTIFDVICRSDLMKNVQQVYLLG